jgi:hypothetical protein
MQMSTLMCNRSVGWLKTGKKPHIYPLTCLVNKKRLLLKTFRDAHLPCSALAGCAPKQYMLRGEAPSSGGGLTAADREEAVECEMKK